MIFNRVIGNPVEVIEVKTPQEMLTILSQGMENVGKAYKFTGETVTAGGVNFVQGDLYVVVEGET